MFSVFSNKQCSNKPKNEDKEKWRYVCGGEKRKAKEETQKK